MSFPSLERHPLPSLTPRRAFRNIYTRRVLAGEFQVVCPWLLKDLVELGLWDDDMKDRLIAHGGSVQNIAQIPDDIKAIYKTVWEISQKKVIELSADRGAFIDQVCPLSLSLTLLGGAYADCLSLPQSQSLNIHLTNPTFGQLTSMHFYGWKRGLKTGMYYLRTRPAVNAIQFTVSADAIKEAKQSKAAADIKSQVAKAASASQPSTPVKVAANGSLSALANGINKLSFSPSQIATPPRAPMPVTPTSNDNGSSSSSNGNGVPLPPLSKTLNAPPPMAATVAVSNGFSVLTKEDASTETASPSSESNGKQTPAADEDITFEEAQRRAAERAEAALQCSIDNKDACMMCSG